MDKALAPSISLEGGGKVESPLTPEGGSCKGFPGYQKAYSAVLRLTFVILGLFFSMHSFAQDKPDMADIMRSNGKIYVVVAVCLIILIGLFLYVMLIDRKVRRMEREMEIRHFEEEIKK